MSKKQKSVDAPEGMVKARVLSDGRHGRVNSVVVLAQADADAAQALGEVDATPESVAYAESLAAVEE